MTLNVTFSEVELTKTESMGQEIVSSQQPSVEQDIGSSGPDTNGESGGFNDDLDYGEDRVTEL